jgi:hypothetical protein
MIISPNQLVKASHFQVDRDNLFGKPGCSKSSKDTLIGGKVAFSCKSCVRKRFDKLRELKYSFDLPVLRNWFSFWICVSKEVRLSVVVFNLSTIQYVTEMLSTSPVDLGMGDEGVEFSFKGVNFIEPFGPLSKR